MSNDSFDCYIKRVHYFFDGNNIKNEQKKKALFLASCGGDCFRLLQSLILPKSLEDLSFIEIVEILEKYLSPIKNVIVDRYIFFNMVRDKEMTIKDFVKELKFQASKCGFENNIEEMIRDRLVCGINNKKIQQRFFIEKKLDLNGAIDIAISMESADSNTEILNNMNQSCFEFSSNSNVHFFKSKEKTVGDSGCSHCGFRHNEKSCKFSKASCFKCGQQGHIASVCRSKKNKFSKKEFKNSKKGNQNEVSCGMEDENCITSQAEDVNVVSKIMFNTDRNLPYVVSLLVNGCDINFEIDTGASVSIIAENSYNYLKKLNRCNDLQKSNIFLKSYSGDEVPVLGKINVNVEYDSQEYKLDLYVKKGKGINLLGRNWLKVINFDWNKIFYCPVSFDKKNLDAILSKYNKIFSDELGTIKDIRVKILLKENYQPRFVKARPLPFALKQKVEEELNRLQDNGVLTPVKYSEWAAPIVPILKKNGSLRICGDYKVTINKEALLEQYPLPRIDELFARLGGATRFSTLDMSNAYQQLLLDDKSREYLTINTHKGLFAYNRLAFGVASAPAIFQRVMDGLFQDIPGVCVYLDDILVTGRDDSEHNLRLEEVLKRMEDVNLKLNKDKCSFNKDCITYLGHKIDKNGLHPTDEKIKAILKAPSPVNVSQLKAFLGMLTYYNNFIPNLAVKMQPLYKLLRKGVKWNWGKFEELAFEKAKLLLVDKPVLTHFDDRAEIIMACDASEYGVGAVLSHKFNDGSEKPIGFASRSLNSAERNYGQIDKEALAIIFGLKKFNQYIYGRKFKIFTDHRPLLKLLGPNERIPETASSRMQRWSIILSGYNYEIVYKSGSKNSNADAMSRLVFNDGNADISSEYIESSGLLFLASCDDKKLFSKDEIKKETLSDNKLKIVYRYVKESWPNSVDRSFLPFFIKRNELTLSDECLHWGDRVIIPESLRDEVLNYLHSSHPGISRMKALARKAVWWPGIDEDIKKKVEACTDCQQCRSLPPKAPVHPWEWPESPWNRLHIDIAGPVLGKYFLITVDSHSKWLEVDILNNIRSVTIIRELFKHFATFGLPEYIVSDNAANFRSEEFERFLENNGIIHINSPPYHPASNGQAERCVRTVKEFLKKTVKGDLELQLIKFLHDYRNTPHATTNLTPAQMLLRKEPLSRYDLLFPGVKDRVIKKQLEQKYYRDRLVKEFEFRVGDLVFVLSFNGKEKWKRGIIVKKKGKSVYEVSIEDGAIVNRHRNQIRIRNEVVT